MNKLERNFLLAIILFSISTIYLITENTHNPVATLEEKILNSYFINVFKESQQPFVLNPYDYRFTFIEAFLVWVTYIFGIWFIMDIFIDILAKSKTPTKPLNTKSFIYFIHQKIKKWRKKKKWIKNQKSKKLKSKRQ